MIIALNYRHKNERLEEALQELGHSVIYNLWDIDGILSNSIDTVIFEFKQILKDEFKFLRLAHKLKKAKIPVVTWCRDTPNIGARRWKLTAILKLGLVDIFATHSLQEFSEQDGKVLYLPNAAWTSKYNLGRVMLEELRNPDIYTIDVSFIGNIDARKCPEHKKRFEFLQSLGELLRKNNITYSFVDSKNLNFDAQVKLIQKAKINLNYGCAADRYEIKSWGLPERCYGIPACGGFLLTDERVHARDDFIEGGEIVMFKDLNDCFEKIKYYLNSPEKRRRIAENAYKRVVGEHTYKHRAEKLINAIESLKKDGVVLCSDCFL